MLANLYLVVDSIKYKLRFFFDCGSGICVWAENEIAQKKYGYPVANDMLPISKALANELDSLVIEYDDSIDWEYPPNPSPWTEEQIIDFSNRVNVAYIELCKELGPNYEVKKEFDDCI